MSDADRHPIEVWRMRVALPVDVPEPGWPDGLELHGFRPFDAHNLHALLEHGYRNGGGTVAAFGPWLEGLTGDEEFDPELCFLLASADALAAAAICWTSAFVKDLVVHESWRRRGLGEGLLHHIFRAFGQRGAAHVDLKVEADNTPAVRLYERVGMRVVERL
jgi:ribosomal protein S18 acetylase RimI-like enzyme